MKKHFFAKSLVLGLILFGLAACKSEEKRNQSIGFNGGFEAFEDGLPVNWILYTSKTAGEGDFDIVKDSINFSEGKASLKFAVRTCSGKPGRYSPGFTREIDAVSGATYILSFKLKNEGCKWVLNVSCVDAFNAAEKKVISDLDTVRGWQTYQCQYSMPEKMERFRVELNVLSPGVLNVDDIRIEEVESKE